MDKNPNNFKHGETVKTTFGGEAYVGTVLYVEPRHSGWLVVADWKKGEDLSKNVAVFQMGVHIEKVTR